jgi:hypothetical protein
MIWKGKKLNNLSQHWPQQNVLLYISIYSIKCLLSNVHSLTSDSIHEAAIPFYKGHLQYLLKIGRNY